jgi:serine phosphatase RsbU (regulator of sigma subunit)
MSPDATRCSAGELLCLVTDGVVDAQDATGERYRSERLQSVLQLRGSNENAPAWSIGYSPTCAHSPARPSRR